MAEKRGGVSTGDFAGIGLQFAIAVIGFLFLGQWLDRRFGTSPVFVLLGVFVGAGAAFYSMYRKLMAAQARHDDRKTGQKTEEPKR